MRYARGGNIMACGNRTHTDSRGREVALHNLHEAHLLNIIRKLSTEIEEVYSDYEKEAREELEALQAEADRRGLDYRRGN